MCDISNFFKMHLKIYLVYLFVPWYLIQVKYPWNTENKSI